MFARTDRLLLRPGWAEDAPALARAIADEAIVRNLATAPWPYGVAEAEAFLAAPRDPVLPSFLITERTDAAPRLIGACGFGRRPSGAVELGYWIARRHWNRGFATEAGQALIDIARTLRLAQLEAVALRRQSRLGPRAREARLRRHRAVGRALQLRAQRRSDDAAVPAGPGGRARKRWRR